MSTILRFIVLFLMLVFVSSCSSSKRSVTHRKSERKTIRKHKKSESKEYARVRDEVIIHALKHVGRDYKYGGKSPSSGFDCSGLVTYVFGKAGIKVNGASHHQARLGSWKSRSDLETGDLVFFGKGKKVSHVAIVMKNSKGKLDVIHSTSSSGVRIDEISQSPYWNKRYLFSRDVIARNPDYVSGN